MTDTERSFRSQNKRREKESLPFSHFTPNFPINTDGHFAPKIYLPCFIRNKLESEAVYTNFRALRLSLFKNLFAIIFIIYLIRVYIFVTLF